jgi:hypothetical protein
MDQNQSSALFGLGVDNTTKAHLAETARWARFLAIVGFVMCALVVLIGLFFGTFVSLLSGRAGGDFGDAELASGLGPVMAVVYIIIAGIMFLPYLFMFRFANKMKAALASSNQETFNQAFQDQKTYFRIIGILTIIGLIFFGLGLLFAIIAGASAGF